MKNLRHFGSPSYASILNMLKKQAISNKIYGKKDSILDFTILRVEYKMKRQNAAVNIQRVWRGGIVRKLYY